MTGQLPTRPVASFGMDAMRQWSVRRWGAAMLGALATALVMGLPTDVIPNPIFGRAVDVTWWSYPVLVVTAVIGGLLLATYVRNEALPRPATVSVDGEVDAEVGTELDRPGRAGGIGGLLSFFAIGCPTCNKLVLVALGSTGALEWFGPVQPVLAVGSIVLLAWALRARLRGEIACRIAA